MFTVTVSIGSAVRSFNCETAAQVDRIRHDAETRGASATVTWED